MIVRKPSTENPSWAGEILTTDQALFGFPSGDASKSCPGPHGDH